ncbi:hypothetical protein JMK10_20460 [Rhodovulum sulfidophilum]|uniref:hypothetical protein n=1 Tax=Rhodovulum sulfidophilum TaxID=35806 RepID=UPI001922382C|nr:hypothetical protein [Rhodovulum sulfidophilum]MBL3576284.1 hypothetical protein [Rhodovulum sulfidophilum]MCE8433659.1 hypothetical protein [Rhodovulum sulfidophilum]MCF4119063.1 hypothetical protein [Rhodovulum sulfidophilum]
MTDLSACGPLGLKAPRGPDEELTQSGNPIRQMPKALLSATALAATVTYWMCVLPPNSYQSLP